MDFFTSTTGRRFLATVAIVATAVTFPLLTVGLAAAADWPNWRGPNHNGISDETGWRTDWSQKPPEQLWKKSVGVGYSSVSVVGNRLYTMGNDGKTDTIWCLNADTGEEIWKKSYPCPKAPKGGYPGPRATPTVDGKHVFTMSHNGQVFCLNAASGEVVWSKNVQKELSAGIPKWGLAGSPLVEGKLLILNIGTAGVALDKTSGKIVWKTGSGTAGYNTPVLYRTGERKCLALFNANSIVGLDAAKGKRLWRYPWRNSCSVHAADPIISGRKVFISSGYGTGCALLKIGADKPAVLWRNKNMANHFNSCVLWKGHLYGFDWSKRFKCLDFATGEVKWSQKGFGRESSLMIADGKMIIMRERGTLVIAEPSPTGYKELARKKVLSGTCWTVPVLSGGRIFCRSHQGELICLKVGPKPPKIKPPPIKKDTKPAVVPDKKKPEPTGTDPAKGKLGLAKSYLASGRKEKAKALLTDIVQNHKDSRYASDAGKLLESIR